MAGTALGAAILPLLDASMGLAVVDLPATWLGPGAFAAGTTTNGNNTTATVSVEPSYRPLAAYVNATAGSCVECTPSRLDADDNQFVEIASSGVVTARASYQITTATTLAPYLDTDAPITVVYRGKATTSVTQSLLIKNHTSAVFESLDQGTFQSESELSGSVAHGNHYRDGMGRVTVEIRGAGVTLSYSLQGDLLDVRQTTENATARWLDTIRIRAASDEPASIDVSATHVSMTNSARFTTAALYAADGTTRLLLFGNGTIEEQSTNTIQLAAGNTNAAELRVRATAGTLASWTFDLVATSPSGAWTLTHRITWTLDATA